MSKHLSFYQYLKTVKGGADPKSDFAEAALEDLMFPKYEQSFSELSDYIENYGTKDMSLAIFDELYEDYTEWLKF